MTRHYAMKSDAYMNAKDEQVILARCACGASKEVDSFDAAEAWQKSHQAARGGSGFTPLSGIQPALAQTRRRQ